MEMSYVDLLAKLHADIETDITIFNEEKEKILSLIYKLEDELWKYSG